MESETTSYAALRAAPRKPLAEIVPLAAPFTLHLELTNVCNFRCSYCPIHFDEYREVAGGLHSLTRDEVEHVYQQILALGRLKTLNLYMLGEPFAHRDAAWMIARAKQLNVAERVIVTTNGSLVDEAAARAMIACGLDFLRFSVYGSSSEEMAAVTGSRIPLERIVENVARVRALRTELGASKPHLYAKMIDNGDRASGERFLELFRPYADEVCLEPAMNWNEDVTETNLSGQAEGVLAGQYLSKRKEVCPFPFYTLVVNADLKVTVCCVDWRKDLVVGDLHGETLREVWEGERLRALRVAHLNRRRCEVEGCKNCTFLYSAPDNLDALTVEEFLGR